MTQLTHMGHRTDNYTHDWIPALSASGTREPAHRAFTRVADARDLERIARDFADTALRCKEGGLDGVEISAWAGHLLDEFLTPALQPPRGRVRRFAGEPHPVPARGDRGGARGGRRRLHRRHADVLRRACARTALGIGPDEAVRIAAAFTRRGHRLLQRRPRPRRHRRRSWRSSSRRWRRRRTRTWSSRAGCGSRWTCRSCTRRASPTSRRPATPIAEGLLDLVGMMRALMADPDLPRKVAGRPRRPRPAVRRREHVSRQHLHLRFGGLHPQPRDRTRAGTAATGAPAASDEAMRRRRRRPGRAGGRARSRRARAHGDPVRGELHVRRAGGAGGARRAAARPHRHHRLAGRRMPPPRGRPAPQPLRRSRRDQRRRRGRSWPPAASRTPRSGCPATISPWTAGTSLAGAVTADAATSSSTTTTAATRPSTPSRR